MKMYRYETHLHTAPVSRCAKATVEESLLFYKKLGYDGVFVTNHFLGGNMNVDKSKSYEEKIAFHFSDYEKAVELGQKIGLKVFFGTEMFYEGADFLVYGLDKAWFLAHPELKTMTMRERLAFMRENGALIIHAHPFREAWYIDHIHLFPRDVDGVETLNASRKKEENAMAKAYADHYGLLPFAGSDNHVAGAQRHFAGMCCEEPVADVQDFIQKVKDGKMEIFKFTNGEQEGATK